MDGLGMRFGFRYHVRLVPQLKMYYRGKQATRLAVDLHRNRPRRNDVSAPALRDARTMASGLKQRLRVECESRQGRVRTADTQVAREWTMNQKRRKTSREETRQEEGETLDQRRTRYSLDCQIRVSITAVCRLPFAARN